MIFGTVVFPALFCTAIAGELLIGNVPSSIRLSEEGNIDQSSLPDFFGAALGFTPSRNELKWNGMNIKEPFNFAETLAVIFVDGIDSLDGPGDVLKYRLSSDEDFNEIWEKVRNQVIDRYPAENHTIVDLSFPSSQNIGHLKVNHLNTTVDEDAAFLKEINGLNEFIRIDLDKSGAVPSLYRFNIKTLHELSDLRGSHHAATKEAKRLVQESLRSLSRKLGSMYGGSALAVAVVSHSSHTRKSRSASMDKLDIYEDFRSNIYDPDFPIVFNIILWFTISLVFSLLAVSIFIASMDPGRDSIIYRMTSNRMKKDS